MTTAITPRRLAPAPAFRVHKAFWGTVVRGRGGPPVLLQVAQGIVLALGAACAAGALTLASAGGPALNPAGAGLAAALALLTLLLLWFATRGGVVELQFDLARGELRELVRHRIGPATLVGRHGLGGGATLLVDRGRAARGHAALILRLRGDDGGLCIAEGPEDAILALRRRLDPELKLAHRPAATTLAA